jgi:hypothetical protein
MKKYIYIFAIFLLGGFFLINFQAQAEMIFFDVGAGETTNGGATVTNPTVFNLDTPISTRYLRIDARNDGSQSSSNYIELRAVKAWAGGDTNVLKSIYSGGNAQVVEHNVYNGAVLYNSDLSIDCSGSWNPQGSLCDEDPTADSREVSSKSVFNSGATWNTSGADDTGVLVVDMGSVQDLTEIRVFQMFSDGKTTQIHFSYHPETGGTPPSWNDTGWLNFDGTVSYVKTFSGEGFGSSRSPYQITTCDQLQEMNEDLDGYYVLNNNIDCSQTSTWNGGTGFLPIGDLNIAFTGSFNGANFDISNLTINRTEEDQIGLFGVVSDGGTTLITNVNLKNINIIGNKRVGGLVGYITNNVTVSNSSSGGSVSGVSKVGGLIGSGLQIWLNGLHNNSTVSANYTGPTSQNGVGGIVGVADSVLIENCYNTGNVNAVGTLYTGGLIGSSNSMAINRSYNTGNITGNSSTHTVGGLAGASTGSNFMKPMIWNTYNTGNVSGSQRVGGLIGFTPTVEIYDSYNTGTVTATYLVDATDMGGHGAGGLVGINSLEGLSGQFPGTGNSLNIHNSFNLGSINASKNIGGLVGFIDNVDADHITWQGNEWDRSAKTISTTNNFYYKPSESTLNCNDQLEISECTSKDNLDYFKNTSSVVPFISITENPDLTYWQWNFIGGTEDQPEPVWYVQTNYYPKFTQQTTFPDPTCSDGILNQNETSTDTGGVCAPVVRHNSSGSYLPGYGPKISLVSLPVITSPIITIPALTRTLKLKMIGNDVKALQIYLNTHGFLLATSGQGSSGKETTLFGQLTKKAVIKFQLANGLKGDGVVGPLTQAKLK